MSLFKKEPTLYKEFIKEQKEERLKAEIAAKEAQSEKKNKKPITMLTGGTTEVYVTSFEHGCGATYLAEILAVYFGHYKSENTCLVETKGIGRQLKDLPTDVFSYPCDMAEVYKRHYNFLVRDVGIITDLTKNAYEDLERADYRCVVTWPDEQSLLKLASFVNSTENADSYIYFFNMVPKDKIKFILNTMEDHTVIILPCTSLDNLDKKLVSNLHYLFRK